MLRILLSVRLGEKRWTQKQLADATGIRRNTINDLYHEMTDRVSLEQLDLICKALDCKISDLLVQEEDLDDLTRSRLATPRCNVRQVSYPLSPDTSVSGDFFCQKSHARIHNPGFLYKYICLFYHLFS
jgi:putative transcriptional regulator